MSPWWWGLRMIQTFEDHIIASILRRPGFHRAVGRIHRTIHEKQHGRNPHEPLAPGEATADPNTASRNRDFIKHFFDELKNQVRGKPTELPREPPKKSWRRER